jgi:hypothetical protein
MAFGHRTNRPAPSCMLYIFVTMGTLNCPVVVSWLMERLALVQDRSQVIRRQSGAVVLGC